MSRSLANALMALAASVLAVLALAGPAHAAGGAPSADAQRLIEEGDRHDARLDTQHALASFVEADRLSPRNPEILQRIAREHGLSMDDTKSPDEQRKRGQSCLQYAKQAVDADAGNAHAQLAAAICYGRLASLVDHRTALEYSRQVKEHVDRAIAIDPKNDYAWHVLGAWNYSLASIGGFQRSMARLIYGAIPAASYAEAERCFRKAVELAPERLSHHVELGRTLYAMKRRDDGAAELKRGLALPNREKDDPESRRRAGELLAQNK